MPEFAHCLQLVEQIQQDLRNVVNETKRKYPPIKDNAESQIKALTSLVNGRGDIQNYITEHNLEIVDAFLSGCATKHPKLVTICLSAIQRLITNKLITEIAADKLLETLQLLTESETEELKVLQTIILLITATSTVIDASLANAVTICLKLHSGKSMAIINTAAAAIRQCTNAVFDRIVRTFPSSDMAETRGENFHFTPASKSAFFLFQDICQLTAGEPPHWFTKIDSISRLLGLELIESILVNYSVLFIKEKEFLYLLKERVCPLVIKLSSPMLPSDMSHVKFSGNGDSDLPVASEFAVNVRLYRIIFLLCSKYFPYLNTECEVFLSSLMRLVDNEPIGWRRALALEIIFKIICQPELLLNICESFDRSDPPSHVFGPLVTTTSNYVQGVIRSQPSYSLSSNKDSAQLANNSTSLNTMATGGKPSFIYRGVNFFIVNAPKFSLSEMLERHDAPTLPEGYCFRLAIDSVLQIVWSLQHLIDVKARVFQSNATAGRIDNYEISKQLIEFSWCSLLPALSILLEACCDEKLVDSFLTAETAMVVLSSHYGLEDARSGFIASICKASLPSNYSLTILCGDRSSPKHSAVNAAALTADEALERSPVVHVVNAAHCPGSSAINLDSGKDTVSIVGGSPGESPSTLSRLPTSLYITAKHIQISKALLGLAKDSGALLESSWYLVLSTFQQLLWMLGLKAGPVQSLIRRPTTDTHSGGIMLADFGTMNLNTSVFEPSMQASVSASSSGVTAAIAAGSNDSSVGSGAMGTRAGIVPLNLTASAKVLSELPMLSEMLSTIFEQSNSYDPIGLNFLIDALCKLAVEAADITLKKKEPSHFSIAKLTECGLANIHRLELWWKPVTAQLLSMCKLPHPEIRKLSVNAVILLIKQAIILPRKYPFWESEELTNLVLDPLTQLTDAGFKDVQEKQLECVQYLLHCYGERINICWLRLITIIGAISQSQSDQLIRTALQCFQLVVTDYLSALCFDCYPACVETAAKFGHQDRDLNIALSAIGSLLHLTDFLFQREIKPEEVAQNETLWVTVFCELSKLCRDRRPAVRKSAVQTLFNTVECHSARFIDSTWNELLWTVFFPLLSEVQENCASAPIERETRTSTLLLHHSRDTAAKQWAETVVLTLSGVARCFVSKQAQLIRLDRFPEAWEALLFNAERAVLMANAEIAFNALTTLRILLSFDSASLSQVSAMKANSIWLAFWRTWLSIGRSLSSSVAPSPAPLVESWIGNTANGTQTRLSSSTVGIKQRKLLIPDGDFFALYFELFKSLFPTIRESFCAGFFSDFAWVVEQGVLGPFLAAANNNSTMGSSSDEIGLIPTQRAVFECLELFCLEVQTGMPNIRTLLVPFMDLLLSLSSYALYIPRPGSTTDQVEAIPVSYIIFAEKCMELATELFKKVASSDLLLNASLMRKMIEALKAPMSAKYKCQCQSTWLLASRCLIEVLNVGVPIAMTNGGSVQNGVKSRGSPAVDPVWDTIFQTLRDFLFCPYQPRDPLSGEESKLHEALDCKFVNLICEQFLANSSDLPLRFIEQLVNLLGTGSIQASTAGEDVAIFSIATSSKLPGKETRLPQTSLTETRNLPSVHKTSLSLINDCLMVNNDESCSLQTSTLDNLRPFVCREAFMRLCFESLLRFAFFQGLGLPMEKRSGISTASSVINIFPGTKSKGDSTSHIALCRLAVHSIIDRCYFILNQFPRIVQLTGKCPLPRAKLSEVNFVFQALTLLLSNFMQMANPQSIDLATWRAIIDLYPLIVDCVFNADSTRLFPGLRQLLHLFGGLLQPRELGTAVGSHANALI